MATLRRILKYTPAVVLGLLVVAWVVNLYGHFGYKLQFGKRYWQIDCRLQRFRIYVSPFRESQKWFRLSPGWFWHQQIPALDKQSDLILGWHAVGGEGASVLTLPLPLVLTAIFPLAIGPFISFRFRLWHHLAYTAVVAVELAYYLRWQE